MKLFHRHSWSRWELVPVRCRTRVSGGWYDDVMQQRRCAACGKIQRTELDR